MTDVLLECVHGHLDRGARRIMALRLVTRAGSTLESLLLQYPGSATTLGREGTLSRSFWRLREEVCVRLYPDSDRRGHLLKGLGREDRAQLSVARRMPFTPGTAQSFSNRLGRSV